MPAQSLPTAEISRQLTQFAETAFKVEEQNDGVVTITTPFEHIYSDPIVLYLSKEGDGSYLLSDNGETRFWINEFRGYDAYRRLGPINLNSWRTEAELFQTQVGEGHDLMTRADLNNLSAAIFRLLQTIMHVSGLGMVDDDD